MIIKKLENLNKIFLIFIITLALFVRLHKVSKIPVSLNWDEAAIGYNAYSLLKTGHDEWSNKFPLSFRSFDDFKSPLLIYLTIPFVWILGLTELAVRIPVVLIGSLTPLATYFFLKTLFPDKKNKKLWFLGSLLLAISPWHIQFTRASFEASLALFFVITATTFFLKSLKNKKHYLLYSTIFFGLAIFSYHSAKIFVPLLATALLLNYLKIIKKEVNNYKKIYLLSFLLFLFTIFLSFKGQALQRAKGTLLFFDQFVKSEGKFLFELQKEAYSKGLSENNTLYLVWNQKIIFLLRQFIVNITKHLNPQFLFTSFPGDNQRLFINKLSLLYPYSIILVILGLISLWKKKKEVKKVFSFWLLLALTVPALSMESPHPLRGMFYLFILEIIAVIGFAKLIDFALIKKSKLLVLILGIVMLANIIYYGKIYLYDFPKESAEDWQYGLKQASLYLKDNHQGFDNVYVEDAYGQAYIYYLFYSQKLLTADEVSNHNQKIDNIIFTTEIPSSFSLEEKTLLVKYKKAREEDFGVKENIYFPDGNLAFTIYEY